MLNSCISIKSNESLQFQKTSEKRPIASSHVDQVWGPKLFHIIQKSKETVVKNLSDDALKELNALQRSAKAYTEKPQLPVSLRYVEKILAY